MTQLRDELADMAALLVGESWKTKWPDEWSPLERAAAARVFDACDAGDTQARQEAQEHWDYLLRTPLEVTYEDEDTEDGLGRRIVSMRAIDSGVEIRPPERPPL